MAGYDLWFKLHDKEPKIKLTDLSEGMIVSMEPGYHTNNIYYVDIISVCNIYGFRQVTTSIPGKHTLKIEYGGYGWNYHIGRMNIVGTKQTHGHLLLNQKLD